MRSRRRGTADPTAEREMNFRPRRLCLNVETEGGNHVLREPGSREGVAETEGFPWTDILVPALSCVHVQYREEV